MIDFDLRTVGVVARTASMLLLCTSLGGDRSSAAKREEWGKEEREETCRKINNKIKMDLILELY